MKNVSTIILATRQRRIERLETEKRELLAALKLGVYLLTIPIIRDLEDRLPIRENPISDFRRAARAAIQKAEAK
jgi:hypothetical protein